MVLWRQAVECKVYSSHIMLTRVPWFVYFDCNGNRRQAVFIVAVNVRGGGWGGGFKIPDTLFREVH